MPDLAYEDTILGPCIVTFDGRILEHFTGQVGSAARLIVGLLQVDIDGPDRKGRRSIMFTTLPNKRGGGFRMMVAEEQWAAVEPFVAQVQAAIAA